MKVTLKRPLALVLALTLVLSLTAGAADVPTDQEKAIAETGKFVVQMVKAPTPTPTTKPQGLPNKSPAVTIKPITRPQTTFPDVDEENIHRTAIEALAAREIINGKSDGNYDPTSTMTRSEFATISVKALGLHPGDAADFGDVDSMAWYAAWVGTASHYGIVKGVAGNFLPLGIISRQEAAVMVARSAQLCGLDTLTTTDEERNILSQFDDYTQVGTWATSAVAYCYREGLLDDGELVIQPNAAVTRGEIATMIYQMLLAAELV